MPGRIEFSYGHSRGGARAGAETCRILLLADLLGDALRPPLAERVPLRAAVEILDGLVARLGPRLELAADAGLPALTLDFASLDDFHPDHLLARVPLFADLDATARRLAARSIEAAVPATPPVAPAAPANDFAALLGAAVGIGSGDRAADATRERADDFVRRLLAGTSAAKPAPDPRATVLDAAAALARTQALRALLHHPRVQRLEAVWRALAMLLHGVDAGAGVQVWVLDIGRDELCADLAAGTPELPGLIDAGAQSGGGWGLVVSTESFGAQAADVQVLAALGALAAANGATALAGLDPAIAVDPAGFANDTAAAARWATLRACADSDRVALAAPRLLLRRPYGARSDPVAAGAFEELDAQPVHEDYLWGGGGVGLALLLGRAWGQAEGWDFAPDQERELDDLPMALVARNGDRELVPCAERWLSDGAAQALDGLGATVLVSRRDRNVATVLRFRSLAGALHGRWPD